MDDDLLGPLRDGPLPPLAPAAVMRARGEQRRRRRRAALAGAVALAVVLAGGTAVALTGSGDADELRPVPFASPGPPAADSLWEALLDPEDVQEELGGEWEDLRGGESPFSTQLEGCPETPGPEERSAARFLTDGQTIVGQSLTLHAVDASAEDRFRALLAMMRVCRESSPAYRLFDSGGQVGSRIFGELLVAGEPTRPFSVERVGRAVVTLVLQGRSEPVPAVTEAAAAKVRAELGDDVPSTLRPASTAPAREWFLPEAFLSPEAAGEAEMPGWVVDEAAVSDNLTTVADPCREAEIPLNDRVRDQGERVMGSKREAGGSSLLQEIYRYASAPDAEQAFAEYEQRYARCASVQDPHADEGWTIRSQVRQQARTAGGGSLLVRSIPCSPEGGCTEHFSTYTMLVREAEALTVVAYTIAEDGDPAQEAEALVTAVQERLQQVVRG